MTEQMIFEFAKKAGIQGMLTDVVCSTDELIKFAKLIEKHVKNEIEK